MTKERGVSSVVGVVLLLAITLTMVTSLMVIGTLALNETQSDTQLSQMETSMAQMSSKASLAALGGAEFQRFDLGGIPGGSVEVRSTSGNLTLEIEYENGTTETLYVTEELGAMVYEQGDSEVAYQGGGVWKRTGDDGGEMVSPPEYHYQQETLTFPIVRVSGEGQSVSNAVGSVQHESFGTIYPDEGLENPVDNFSVFVEIQSDYHKGWAEFFESRTTGEVIHDSENRTARMELTVPFEEEFRSAASVQGSIETHGNPNIDSAQEGMNHPSASGEIDSKIENCDSESPGFDGSQEEYHGSTTYCATDPVELGETNVFNTTEGDITVVLEDDLDLSQGGGRNITITGNHTVKIYTQGQINFKGSEVNVGGNSSQIVTYVHSDIEEIGEAGNFAMSGVIYAPNTDVEFSGTVEFDGAVIADTFEAGGNVDLTFAPELEETPFGISSENDVIRYLHVTENVIELLLE